MSEYEDNNELVSAALVGLCLAALSGPVIGVICGSIGTILFIMWGMS